jgi:spore photoproduct lyase
MPEAFLELRTKAVNFNFLENIKPVSNVIVAFTLSPTEIQKQWEVKTPALDLRIRAIQQLQKQGWLIGLRLEPLIATKNWVEIYSKFCDVLPKEINFGQLANIFLGQFRMPKEIFKKIKEMNPESKLFTRYFDQTSTREITNPQKEGAEMVKFMYDKLGQLMNPSSIYY